MSVLPPSKRRHGRLTLKEPLNDQLQATHDVRILDLSVGGARVEHMLILRPGSNCNLRLPLKSATVIVRCQVVWSQAVKARDGEWRGAGLVYQSGLEFAPLEPEPEKLLTAFLESGDLPPADRDRTH